MKTEKDGLPVPTEITEWEQAVYDRLVSVELNEEQVERIIHPTTIYEKEDAVLAVHWHPEMVPLELVRKRLRAMYPNVVHTLIIPTQHNELMTYDDYAGTEVDCRAAAFNRKIQILLHFAKDKIAEAHVLKSMIAHTYKYRQTQFLEFIDTILEPVYEERLQEAARLTGTEAALVDFTRDHTRKLLDLVMKNFSATPEISFKNKLLINYFHALREHYEAHMVERAAIFLAGVKEIVKKHFRLDYFYEVNEIIEETRALGGGVIVPHPEQFWPVLLADYNVDGYEVWNPQSREFTEFLIQVVVKKNKDLKVGQRPFLVVMGDDTHLSEKILPPAIQQPDKAAREVGYQPAWQDLTIRKSLNMGDFEKRKIIDEYRSRLH